VSAWELYWLLKLDDIRHFLISISVILASGGLFGIFIWKMEFNGKGNIKAAIISLLVVVPMLSITATLLPTTKQMAAIYVLPPIINNEKVQQVPNDLLDILGLSIERAKKELSNEIGKKLDD